MGCNQTQTHLELDSKNGIHTTTGSLGHGFPIATGMALGRKLQGWKVGNCHDQRRGMSGGNNLGIIADCAHQLSNLLVLIDYNKIQALTTLEEALPLDDLVQIKGLQLGL